MQIWNMIVKKYPKTQLSQKHVYIYWAQLHKGSWRLDDDQVKSALMVLQHVDDLDVKIIPLPQEDGISSLTFNFKDILATYGEEIIEIAMDSTCKQYIFTKFSH